jgi:hypothetical protein
VTIPGMAGETSRTRILGHSTAPKATEDPQNPEKLQGAIKMINQTTEKQQLLSLALQPGQNPGIRVSKSDLARMLGISPSRVTQLVKAGTITQCADGRIDPDLASKQILKNCNPAKLRIKPFRGLQTELDDLRRQAKNQRAQIDELRQENATQAQAIEQGKSELARVAELFAVSAMWLDAFIGMAEQMPQDQRSADQASWGDALQAIYNEAHEAAKAMPVREALSCLDEGELADKLFPPEQVEPQADEMTDEELALFMASSLADVERRALEDIGRIMPDVPSFEF